MAQEAIFKASKRTITRRLTVGLAMLLVSASCVPGVASHAPAMGLAGPGLSPSTAPASAQPATAAAVPLPEPDSFQDVSPTDAVAINAGIPLSTAPNPRAPSLVFRAASGLDHLRSLDCLAQAVYYEARSQGEDGQRAVAQVVLNRVRHPAFPGSVCGVVYQGPLRAGGGCQFTFTCDGSLAIPATGPAWDSARRVAAGALAGQVYAPVGDSTHYHNQQVVPAWAFRLVKSAVVGAHSFYRLPGLWGEPTAFRQHYAGREPAPSTLIATRLPSFVGAARRLPDPSAATLPADRSGPVQSAATAPPPRPDDRLPISTIREEFRTSGQWLDQAGAVTR